MLTNSIEKEVAMKMRYLALLFVVGCAPACAQTQRTTFTLPADIGEGTIHACAQKENGQLRVVEDPDDCRPSEIALSWNDDDAEPPAPPIVVPCCEKKYQFVGFSERAVQGGKGLLQFTLACQETYAESRICTSNEVAQTTQLPAEVGEPVSNPAPFAWVRPTAIVGRGANIGIESIVGLQGDVEEFSCEGWFDSSPSTSIAPGSGLSVNRYGQFTLSACGAPLKVTCCAVIKRTEHDTD
jgi:hypothetical protein